MKILIATILAALVAPLALAQSAQGTWPSPLDGAHSSVPTTASSVLDLQLPASQNVPYDDDASNAAAGHDSNTSVHGSVSTMVGYSKAYGSSTATGMNLDVDHRSDNGNDVGMRINVMQGRNLPYYGYPGYGYRRGGGPPWPPPAPARASSASDDGN